VSRLDSGEGVVVALVTCPDEATGLTLARTLVEERLAACVNVTGAMRSIYRWQGEVEEAEERLLVLKARADRLEALAARLSELHPYDVPEFLVLPVERGLGPYLEWVRAEGG
jgi:periplasmic divalent cation tolerance protein